MIDFLASADQWLLRFINSTLSTPVGDVLWPLITDYDRLLPVRVILVLAWVALLVRGGTRGRTAALLLIPLLLCTDQLSSSIIKPLVARPRPCHLLDGRPMVEGLRLLVPCGSGMSFPSSHAVNNFGVATLFARYYPRWIWPLYGWATLVALSRPAVGVHYPSDILGGAAIGTLVGLLLVSLWSVLQRRFLPSLSIPPSPGDPQ